MSRIVGTNSTSPLESVQVSKNELKTNWFSSANEPKRTLNGAQKSRFLRGFESAPTADSRMTKSRRQGSEMQTGQERTERERAQKMLKIVGTNSINHLESTKVSKNELKRTGFYVQTNPKRTPNGAQKTAFCVPQESRCSVFRLSTFDSRRSTS